MKLDILNNQSIINRFRLDGKVALVTGASRGIGRALAHSLGEAGAKIAVVAKHSKNADCVADELYKKNIEAISILADVSNVNDIEKMIKTTVNHWGKLTIAVNNAGVGSWKDSLDVTEDDWHETMNVNLKGVFFCSKYEAKEMIKNNYGKIINIASMSGYIVNRPQKAAVYLISKAGVLHITKSLASEWAPYGIRVNSISPGYTKTEQLEINLNNPEGKAMVPVWIANIPLGYMATTMDLQGAAVFLASEVSDYMTGGDLFLIALFLCIQGLYYLL